jgi:LemA protein
MFDRVFLCLLKDHIMENTIFSMLWIAIPLILIVWAIMTYNRFIRLRRFVNEAWSGIAVQLKRRHDVIPSLVEMVKGYMKHEQGTLETITRLRSSAMQELKGGTSLKELMECERALSGAIGKMMINVEQYPDLKASNNFIALQSSLQEIEDALQMSRRYYNGVVRDYLVLLESFPSVIIGKIFKFQPEPFFELDDPGEARKPQITF